MLSLIEEIGYFRFRQNLTLTSIYDPKIFTRFDAILSKLCKSNRRILVPQTLLGEILNLSPPTLSKFTVQNEYTFIRDSNLKSVFYYAPYEMAVMQNLVSALSEINLLEFKDSCPVNYKNFSKLLRLSYCPSHSEVTKICLFMLEDPATLLDIYPTWTQKEWEGKDKIWIASILNQISKLEGIYYD